MFMIYLSIPCNVCGLVLALSHLWNPLDPTWDSPTVAWKLSQGITLEQLEDSYYSFLVSLGSLSFI